MAKILIIEPNSSIANFIGEALTQTGQYSVALATSGAEAQKLCAKLKPDAALLDPHLPDYRLEALIVALRSTAPDLKILLTPLAQTDVPEGWEAYAILRKPFSTASLLEHLARLMATTELEHQVTVPLSPTPTPKPPPSQTLAEDARRLVEGHVKALSHSVRDEPVLLTRGPKVIFIAPYLTPTAAGALAEVVNKAWQGQPTAAEVIRFEGDSETSRYMLYSRHVKDNYYLSLILRVHLPLPTVRQLTREAGNELKALLAA